MKHNLTLIAVFLLCFYASSLLAQDNDLPVNPKYEYKQDKDDKKKDPDATKKPIEKPLQPLPEEPTAVPLDGGLLALLASAGIALYISRKKKK